MEGKTSPLVSVIVPCYNQAKYLPETLDCLIAQTYQCWEAVVIDDWSPDNVADIVSEYLEKDSRIKFVHTENCGVSAARNVAIRNHSVGKYILPLDGDDLITPIYLEHAVAYLETHPECKLVYGLAEKFGAEKGKWDLPEYDFQKLLFDNMIFNPAVFRREDFDRTIGYNENMRAGVEDWDFYLTLLGPEDKVHRLDELVYLYRIKKSSRNTVAAQDDTMIPLRRIIYNNHKEYYQPYVEDIITYVRKTNATQVYIDRVNNSLSMKIGRLFTMPFGKLRDFIRRIF